MVSELGVLSASMLDMNGDSLVTHTWQFIRAVSGLAMSMGALVQAQQASNESLVHTLDCMTQDGNRNARVSRGPLLHTRPNVINMSWTYRIVVSKMRAHQRSR